MLTRSVVCGADCGELDLEELEAGSALEACFFLVRALGGWGLLRSHRREGPGVTTWCACSLNRRSRPVAQGRLRQSGYELNRKDKGDVDMKVR